MSMLPLFFNEPWEPLRPSRILNQHFGLELLPQDLLSPLTYPIQSIYPSRLATSYYRPWRSSAAAGDMGSYIKSDNNKYKVNLDVQQFAPNEISVQVGKNNTIIVEGKHEEKQDEHGFISRYFVRRYVLPDGHDVNKVACSLSSDGVLSITVPHVGQNSEQFRTIPIQQTEAPLKSSSKKKQDGCNRVCANNQKEENACQRVSPVQKPEEVGACQRVCPFKTPEAADAC